MAAFSATAHMVSAQTQDTAAWDKVAPKSDLVGHQKVTYPNRFGITISADTYRPLDADPAQRLSARALAHPFGGVKEQTSGLYAQTLAERGFVTVAFDVSYTGESGGEPRQRAAAQTWVEHFSATLDDLGQQADVDRARIGVIGICGGGGFALAAVAVDPRIKAVATSVIYDIGSGNRQGLSETCDLASFQQRPSSTAVQRWAEVDGADPVFAKFIAYYATPLGQHPGAGAGFDAIISSKGFSRSIWSKSDTNTQHNCGNMSPNWHRV